MTRTLVPLGLLFLATWATPATATVDLVDASGLEYFINDDTSSSSSSASGAASDATYTQAVPTTTTSGATTTTTLGDAFDGYNAVRINDTFYNDNGAATLDCNNRDVVLGEQTIGDLTVSRRVYVPDNDAFARWSTTITNNGTADAAVQFDVVNNLGSDGSTEILGSSSGDVTAEVTDTWVATGGDYFDPRLAHVLHNGQGTVAPSLVEFVDGDDNPTWRYEFTLAAGQTGIIVNFVSGQPTNADALTKGAEIVTLPATTTQCMTQEQWDQVLNLGVDCSADDDDCNTGVYDPTTGMCGPIVANEGGTCDDGDKCTVDDVCAAGVCAGVEDPDLCDDEEPKDPGTEPETPVEEPDDESGCGCSSASPSGVGFGSLLLLGLVGLRRRG